ncbi:4-alpha-glucanotransferase [Nocardioides piscis]|uniref:4-alpha-glucanotransferase n=1 Tax=Nocardioides piscis TaxID=2714938 RepID=A0A6G7YIS7_9ACTN|nr:4-alpha-glucanotransferase [Nocardioides piscis]QIK76642.1 4-alpha-glucanotransferase [Nocardioides piscis]
MREQDLPFDRRRAGVLLHVTSLPGGPVPSGTSTGDLGDEAYRFVDFLAAAGCSVWQVLPLVPTHPGDGSPYNAPSAMAGNTALISRRHQSAHGLESAAALDERQQDAFGAWCVAQADWLAPYVEFMAIRETQDLAAWQSWPQPLRDREPAAVAEVVAPLADRVQALRFEQWVFAVQWERLRDYAASKGVLLFGDLPIFVSLDSADVWASRESFQLDEQGHPFTVAGCPPDYFAADGQRWGNPHYDWDAMAADGFGWWRRRIARQRELFDLVRIDHFRGFEAAWHVPAEAETAREGQWVRGPGADLLSALVETAGAGSLVAEDLGTITPEVEALLAQFGLPGMKVLQFAFDGERDNPYLPARHGEQSVVYTGTHDNDTTLGWWEQLDEESRERVRSSLADPTEPMPWALVRLALQSTARLSVIPAQDLLGLGSEGRMNTPGTADGNWDWQAPAGAFDDELAARVRDLVAAADRLV